MVLPESQPGLMCLNKGGDMMLYRKGSLYQPVIFVRRGDAQAAGTGGKGQGGGRSDASREGEGAAGGGEEALNENGLPRQRTVTLTLLVAGTRPDSRE